MRSSKPTYPASFLLRLTIWPVLTGKFSACNPCLKQASLLLYGLFLHIPSNKLLFDLFLKFNDSHRVCFVYNSRHLGTLLFTGTILLVIPSWKDPTFWMSTYILLKDLFDKAEVVVGTHIPHWRGADCTGICMDKPDCNRRTKDVKLVPQVEYWLHLAINIPGWLVHSLAIILAAHKWEHVCFWAPESEFALLSIRANSLCLPDGLKICCSQHSIQSAFPFLLTSGNEQKRQIAGVLGGGKAAVHLSVTRGQNVCNSAVEKQRKSDLQFPKNRILGPSKQKSPVQTISGHCNNTAMALIQGSTQLCSNTIILEGVSTLRESVLIKVAIILKLWRMN